MPNGCALWVKIICFIKAQSLHNWFRQKLILSCFWTSLSATQPYHWLQLSQKGSFIYKVENNIYIYIYILGKMLSCCGICPVICFRQCVLHIFSISNTHVKCRLKKMCYGNGTVSKAIYLIHHLIEKVFLQKKVHPKYWITYKLLISKTNRTKYVSLILLKLQLVYLFSTLLNHGTFPRMLQIKY